MVRIGILGCGFLATAHARRYAGMEGVEVAAVAAPDEPTALAQDVPNATVTDDAIEMYNEVTLDAVDVCTPTTHRELVVPALERGLDVLCEQPIERTTADARAIADAAATADATVMPGHTLRFVPEYVKARERLNAGDIGPPGTARTFRQSPLGHRHDRAADEEQRRGVLIDLAIRDFDFLRWSLGAVERVFARRRRWDDHEYALTTMRFESDAVAHVDARDRSDLPFVTRFEIAGEEGLLEFDSEDSTPIEIDSDADTNERGRDSIGDRLGTDPHRRELEAFVGCVRSNEEPPVTIDDGLEALGIALAAVESASAGRPVAVTEVSA